MKKEELKVGYVVEIRNGDRGMIFELANSTLFALFSDNRIYLNKYCEDLHHIESSQKTIIKIYGLSYFAMTAGIASDRDRDLLWERDDKKYYIRPKGMCSRGYEYWNFVKRGGYWIIRDKWDNKVFQTQFTESEIKELTGQELDYFDYEEVK